jgi:tRNA modification GTPase
VKLQVPTRDTIEEEITLAGMKYRFIDTAGIRETIDTIEKIGVGRSMEKIKEARVIIICSIRVKQNPLNLMKYWKPSHKLNRMKSTYSYGSQ